MSTTLREYLKKHDWLGTWTILMIPVFLLDVLACINIISTSDVAIFTMGPLDLATMELFISSITFFVVLFFPFCVLWAILHWFFVKKTEKMDSEKHRFFHMGANVALTLIAIFSVVAWLAFIWKEKASVSIQF